MKRFGFLLLAVVAALAVTACGNDKNYSISDKDVEFTASVVEEKDENGKMTPYFALNDYRLAFNSKKDAVKYFNDFKKEYESKAKEETGGYLFVSSLMEGFDLHVVKVRDDIRYVDFEADPNYAVGQESRYSDMSTDALLDEYEQKCGELLFVMAELSERKLSSKQEKRLMQIVERIAEIFD